MFFFLSATIVNFVIDHLSHSFSPRGRPSSLHPRKSYATSLFTSRTISKNTCLRAVSDGAASRHRKRRALALMEASKWRVEGVRCRRRCRRAQRDI